MWLFAFPAFGADVHLALFTGDGLNESMSWSTTTSFTQRFGPVRDKKASRVYTVTSPTTLFDPLRGGYLVELSVCVEWTEKKSADRFCQKEELLAPPEASGPTKHQVAVKGRQTFSWSVAVWYTGEPPVPMGLPMEEPPAEDAE